MLLGGSCRRITKASLVLLVRAVTIFLAAVAGVVAARAAATIVGYGN